MAKDLSNWWKDKKLLAGIILVLASIIVGFYGKALSIVKFYEPVYLITGLSIWAFSWILMLLGIFIVGWENVKMIQNRIKHHVKKTVKNTYDQAKDLQEKGYRYTKRLHKKSMNKLSKTLKTSKVIARKMKP